MKDYFSKAGLIRINPETLQPAIKIYRNEDGLCKGDGLISYKMAESVSIAKDIFSGGHIKYIYFQHFFNKTWILTHSGGSPILIEGRI